MHKMGLSLISVLLFFAASYAGVGYGDSPVFALIGSGILSHSQKQNTGNISISHSSFSRGLCFTITGITQKPSLDLMTLSGKKIKGLTITPRGPSKYSVRLSSQKSLTSGLYFLRLNLDRKAFAYKFMVLNNGQ